MNVNALNGRRYLLLSRKTLLDVRIIKHRDDGKGWLALNLDTKRKLTIRKPSRAMWLDMQGGAR